MTKIQTYFPQTLIYSSNKGLIIKVPSFMLKNIIVFLKFHTKTQFKTLIDLSAVDYIEKKFRFEIFYNLLSLKKNHRILITTTVHENKFVDSLSSVFGSAN